MCCLFEDSFVESLGIRIFHLGKEDGDAIII